MARTITLQEAIERGVDRRNGTRSTDCHLMGEDNVGGTGLPTARRTPGAACSALPRVCITSFPERDGYAEFRNRLYRAPPSGGRLAAYVRSPN